MFDFLFKRRAAKMAEKRHYRRFGVEIDGSVDCDGQSIPVRIRDVSQHGARLHLIHGHPPAKIVCLHWGEFEKVARVAWSNDNECGLHFDEGLTLEELDTILAAQ